MKKTIKLLVIVTITILQLLSSAVSQDLSIPQATNDRLTQRPIITLDNVYNITQVSPNSQTTLPDLSPSERALIDPDYIPPIVGVERNLVQPFVIQPSNRVTPDGFVKKNDEVLVKDSILVLTSFIKSENAKAMRVKFRLHEEFSQHIKIFTYTPDGQIFSPYNSGMFYENELWSRVYYSEIVFIQVQIPLFIDEARDAFNYLIIETISHIDYTEDDRQACIEDVNCPTANSYSGITALRNSVAIYHFQKGGFTYQCSGALLNNANSNQSYQPIFQTVGHCINSQAEAQTATFQFDFRTTSCNSGAFTPQVIHQATRLWSDYNTTSTYHDYSLLLLEEDPDAPWRIYLGWTNSSVSNNTVIHNVNHPSGQRQRYTRAFKSFTYLWERCNNVPTSVFDYIKYTAGTTLGGSSGSPWVIWTGASNQVVGAHMGKGIKSGSNCVGVTTHCDYDSFFGFVSRMNHFYSYIEPWLQGTVPVNMSISSSNLSFGTTTANTHKDMSITFTNQSSSGFNLDMTLSFTGTNANQFRFYYHDGSSWVTSTTMNLYLAPGKHKSFFVRFQPNCGGSMSANLRVVHNATNMSSPHNISLSGCAIPAQPGTISGPSPVCSGTSNTYSISSVCGATSYQWEYTGGGTPSGSGTSVSLTPTSSGTLRVRAVNSCGSSSWRSRSITVNNAPSTPGPISGPTTVCSGDCHTYSISSVSGATSYTWEYTGGGTPSGSGTSITLCPTSSGTLRVRANNACGSSSWRTLSISVNHAPSTPGSISGPTTVCSGDCNSYSISPVSGATSYQWEYTGGGTPSGSGTSITLCPTSSGTLRVRALNNCGSSSWRSLSITVNHPPSTPGPITGPSPVCSGDCKNYSISSVSGATSYQWEYSGGGSPSGSGTSITLCPTSSGTLRVRAANNCGNSSWRERSITVITTPSTPGPISGPDEVCSGTTENYTISSVSGATSYQWEYSGGGTPSGSGTSVSLTPTSSGTLRVRAVNECGSSSWREKSITVITTPSTPGPISGPDEVCSGTTENYTISSVSGATSYQWEYTGSGTPSGSGTSVSLTPTSSGTLRVRAVNNCGNSSWREKNITVINCDGPSQPGPITGPGDVCLGDCDTYSILPVTGATSYEWEYTGGGTPSGSGTSITLCPTSSGTLRVRAINQHGSSPWRTLTINVNNCDGPSQPGPITGPGDVCLGDCDTYSIQPVTGATSYEWEYTGGGAPSGSGTSITLCPTSSGTLRVRAINQHGSSPWRTLAINVDNCDGPPQPGPITGPGSICSGDCDTYTIQPVTGATSYQWEYTGGGTPSGSGTSITLCPTSSGTLRVRAVNQNGSSPWRTLAITVLQPPAMPGTISGPSVVEPGDCETYSISAVSGATSYEWQYTGGGTPSGSGTSITLCPTSSGTLRVRAINNCGPGNWRDKPITVGAADCNPPVNLQAEVVTNNHVQLTWEAPSSKSELIEIPIIQPGSDTANFGSSTSETNQESHDSERLITFSLVESQTTDTDYPQGDKNQVTLHYDGDNSGGVGITAAGTIYAAVRFPASMLAPYSGYVLEDVMLYIHNVPSNATLMIWGPGSSSSPGSVIHEQSFTPTGNSWHTISLNASIIINAQNDLWVGYMVTQPSAMHPCGIDSGPAADDGDWVSMDGTNWEKLSDDYDIDRNLNIRAKIAPGSSGSDLVGYKIFRNSSLISTVGPSVLSYTDGPLSNGTYNYTVVAVYDDCESPPAGPVQVVVGDCQPPDWTPATNMQFNMNLTGQIIIDDEVSLNSNDIVGAFVDGECRGVASPDASGFVFLTIVSNVQSGETVNLLIWDSTECDICDPHQSVVFESFAQIGTPGNPYPIECGSSELTLNFGTGFTWFSVNVNPGSMDPNDLFSDLSPCENDRIIGQTNFATYFNNSWIGSLTSINSIHSYVMELCSEQSITIIGGPAPINPISLNTGFTWLGYLPQSTLPINTALANISPSPDENDRLIGQTSFATYFNNQWIGSLTQLNPGAGYVIDLSHGVSLSYPDGTAKHYCAPGELQKPLISPTGQYPAENMQHNMTMIAQLITEDGKQSFNNNDVVYAFVGDECRGIANVTEHNGALFLTIGSNLQAGETVNFRAWLDEVNELFEIRESVSFEAFRAMGTMDNPFILTLDAPLGEGFAGHENWHIGDPYPNPFTGSTYIPYHVGGNSEVSLKVFNSIGQVVFNFSDTHEQVGKHQLTFERGNLQPGVYHFRMEISASEKSWMKTGRVVIM